MINNAAARHQSELLSSAKEVVAASRQLKLPLQSFMSWDWNVSLTLNKGEAAPSWLARKTDFNLLKSWLAELLKALKDGKVILDKDDRLLPRWTIGGFMRETRFHRQQLTAEFKDELLEKIASLGQAGEKAGVARGVIQWWERDMKERFCQAEELFSDSQEKQMLDNDIKDQRSFQKVMSALSVLLNEIKKKRNEGGVEGVNELFASQYWEPEQIHHRLFSRPFATLHDDLNLLTNTPSSRASSSPSLSVFTVGRR